MHSANEILLQELEEELHDLCQPLTALHFRLELGKFGGRSETLREAVDGALEESVRMIDSIKRMRQRVTKMKAAGVIRSSQEDLSSRVDSRARSARN